MLSLLALCVAAVRACLLPGSRASRARRRNGHEALKTTDDDESEEEEHAACAEPEPAHVDRSADSNASRAHKDCQPSLKDCQPSLKECQPSLKEDPLGQRVTIFGLVSQAELNGRTGVATRSMPEYGNERYAVIMAGGVEVAVRAANLRVVRDEPQFRYH